MQVNSTFTYDTWVVRDISLDSVIFSILMQLLLVHQSLFYIHPQNQIPSRFRLAIFKIRRQLSELSQEVYYFLDKCGPNGASVSASQTPDMSAGL